MKRYSILILLSFTLYNCQSYKAVKPQNVKFATAGCEKLLQLVESNWKVHTEDRTYMETENFITTIRRDYKNCIRGLSRNQVKQIFGTPNKDNRMYTTYYLSSNCLNVTSNTKDCYHLIFVYDKTGKVKSYTKTVSGVEN